MSRRLCRPSLWMTCRNNLTKLTPPAKVTAPTAIQPLPQQQRRWNWQIYVKNHFDVEKNKTIYEEIDIFQVFPLKGPSKHGVSLVERHYRMERHLKPTTVRKYIRSRKEYRNRIKRIDDLTNYIQFMKERRTKK